MAHKLVAQPVRGKGTQVCGNGTQVRGKGTQVRGTTSPVRGTAWPAAPVRPTPSPPPACVWGL